MILDLLFAAAVIGAAMQGQTPAPDQDQDRSKERLIRRMLEGEQDDVMVRIVTAMDQVEQRLGGELDPGPDTQALQKQIVSDLDLAIEQARQNMRTMGNSASQPDDQQPEKELPGEASADTAGGSSGQGPDAGAARDDIELDSGGFLQELRRQWGNLPQNTRDEITQGLTEDMHEAFREQIRRYYEALSKQPDTRSKD